MRPPPILVHVAGAPGPDRVQRCLSCGAELYDGRPHYEGRTVVLIGEPDLDGPSWWPAGALVATDRHVAGNGPVITYVVEANVPLDDDEEQPCTGPSRRG